MKKILLLLAVLLLLCGCGENAEGEPSKTQEPTQESVYTGTYEKDSPLEKQTMGAIRQFRPGGNDYTAISAMSSQLLLVCEGEQGRVELLTGPECAPAAAKELGTELSPSQWQVTATGFVYYDPKVDQIICLDSTLNQTQAVALPEDMTGDPVLSDDGKAVFYCRGQELRALDLQQGIDRLIRSHTCASQEILGSYFEGKVIRCSLTREDGSVTDIFVDAQSGGILRENTGITELTTDGEDYYLCQQDGVTVRYICGKRDGQALQLISGGSAEPALALGLLVTCEDTEQGTVLSCYSTETGYMTASVTLTDTKPPLDIWADSRNGCLWLLMEKGVLLSWEPAASSVKGEEPVTGPVYTEEDPDVAALEPLQTYAGELGEQYGVELCIWHDAVELVGDRALVQEYQPEAISRCLEELEPVLDRFPEGFLKKFAEKPLRICIVRSVDGTEGAVWFRAESRICIALTCGSDVETEFLKALGYVVDIHILGNSSMVDQWGNMNPEGFTYGTAGEPGEAFAEPQAMVSVTDDRASVFRMAMLPGNEELFASETMQNKLLTLCKAIRDAWGWKRKADVYPWEQYLTESIAYNK